MNQTGEYYQQSRPEMLGFIPKETRRLLDIGCSNGYFGESVKSLIPDCETWGVEANPNAASEAATRNDRVYTGYIDTIDLPAVYFDVVTMNDVLEHIPESEPVLAKIRRLLKPSGKLVISVPNVRYYLNVRDLLIKGEWQYQDFGILDRTHMRFFTFKSIRRLLVENGFTVDYVGGINHGKLKMHYKIAFALSPGRFSDMKFPQIAVVSQMKA
jgi:2-polyprenyl-3-methyl-5-hydroxy-6-metoxy-1,4-benzoquinol methylase